MENEEYQPTDKCHQAARNSNKHEPTHHTELVKELAVIVAVYNAGMRRAFIHFAAVRIRNPSAQHH